MKKTIVIGTRNSQLALWQAEWVKAQLAKFFPQQEFKLQERHTKGDRILEVSLAKIGDKGLFTQELEEDLLQGRIDLAVHSLKDVPTILPEGLIIGAVTLRENPADVLLSKNQLTLDELPLGAKIGTSSLRRTAQLLAYRPDLQIEVVRGNLQTRLRKLQETDLAALVLAYAGVHRLGLEAEISQFLAPEICLPAVGQGVLGIEIMADNPEIAELVAVLEDSETRACITAERAFMRELEGGCQVPLGALGRLTAGNLVLEGLVADLDGKTVLRESWSGQPAEAELIGQKLAQRMRELGAEEILEKVRELNHG